MTCLDFKEKRGGELWWIFSALVHRMSDAMKSRSTGCRCYTSKTTQARIGGECKRRFQAGLSESWPPCSERRDGWITCPSRIRKNGP